MKKKSGGANDAPDALFAAVIVMTIAKQPWTGCFGSKGIEDRRKVFRCRQKGKLVV